MGLNSRAVETPPTLANAHMRLFGGAQFHRAMEEFRLAVGEIQVWFTSRYRSCGEVPMVSGQTDMANCPAVFPTRVELQLQDV